jgi:Flp pilus assembly protein TadD
MFVIPSLQLHAFDRSLGAHGGNVPGISAERTQALLAGANRIGYGEYLVRSGKLEAQLVIEDAGAKRTVRVVSAAGPAEDLRGVAGAVARQLYAGAKSYPNVNPQALRAYVTALESTDPAAAVHALDQAIAADPSYGPPYLLLSEIKVAQQDRAGAETAIRQGLQHAPGMPAVDRARLNLESATLSGDRAARQQAFMALAAVNPNDASVWRALGEDAIGRRQYAAAVEALRKAVTADPREPANLNTLGYAAAYAGDLKTATEALERYRKLRPNEPNPFDSLGDVNFYLGRLKEAERFYLEANQKDPNFLGSGTLFKAAMAHLMTGDVAGADTLARRYVDARQAAKDPLVEYRKADWSWISGRRKEGFDRLSTYAKSTEINARELSGRAYAQLALWSLELGDRAAATGYAERAGMLAVAGSLPIAKMARFLVQSPANSSEWAVRAEREFSEPGQASLRNFARAYALLLAQEYPEAALLLREMYQASNPVADETLPVLLAWSYLRTGRTAEAAPLLAANPIPSGAGPTPFSTMHFPRLIFLRGELAAKQGSQDEARRLHRLFLLLSGPQPLVWDEEAKAAAASR